MIRSPLRLTEKEQLAVYSMRRTSLYGGQLELVPRVSDLDKVHCNCHPLPLQLSPDQQVQDNNGDQWQQIIQQEQRHSVALIARLRVPVFFTSFVFVIVVEIQHIRNDCDDADDPNDERHHSSGDELHLTK